MCSKNRDRLLKAEAATLFFAAVVQQARELNLLADELQEEIFSWLKTVGGMGKLRHRGLESVRWIFTFATAAYYLVRIRNLAAVPALELTFSANSHT